MSEWLLRHSRFHLHFTPTSSSWLNIVERRIPEITRKAIRRGAFGCVPDLAGAINAYIEATNDHPRPFIWSATADTVLEKIARCKAIYETVH